ncbi:hypothetical protein [Streptomyces sp. ODS28]|uniref:hypothetical protein n=1 Tax=Streptomyces sp. ODS28 TaxID=3136688 RepID=UPI0031EE8D79
MSDFIDCLKLWLGEPSRRALRALGQRLNALLSRPTPPTAHEVLPAPPPPTYARRPLPPHLRAQQQPINGHTLDMLRPYVRERHTTAATARESA